MLKPHGFYCVGSIWFNSYSCLDCESVIGEVDSEGNYYPEVWKNYTNCPYCGNPLYEKKQEEKVKIEITWTKEN